MSEVYVVLQGEYSDRHIVAIFSVATTAQKVATAVRGDVETWELDPACVLPTMSRYRVCMARDTGAILVAREIEALRSSDLALYRPTRYELWLWPDARK